MKMKSNKKLLSNILCIALIVAMALCTNGCNGSAGNEASSGAATQTDAGNVQADAENSANKDSAAEKLVYGEEDEGLTKFILTVTDQEGTETEILVHTDKETVGEALLEFGLIEGEESEYGLYVKTVNGITADYDKDGVYWAFYINGEYAQSGVDTTPVTEGDAYAFKVE